MSFKLVIILNVLLLSCDLSEPNENILHDYTKPQRIVDFKTYNTKITYDGIDHSPYIDFNKDLDDYRIIMSENVSYNSLSVHTITFQSSTSVEFRNFTSLKFEFENYFEVTNNAHSDMRIWTFQIMYRILGEPDFHFINANNLDNLLEVNLPIHFRIIMKLSSGDISVINNPINTATMHIKKLSIFGEY